MAKSSKTNGRTSGKRNGKAQAAPRKQREKPPKKTAEQLSDMELQKLLFDHKRKIVPLIEAKKTAEAALKKAYDLAKEEGIPKKDIEIAISLETEEGEEKQSKTIERIMRVARWSRVKLGTQLDMFGATKETVAERHFEDGRVAALNDLPAKPPAHLAQKDAQTWLEGHAAGRTALNVERAQGFRPLGEVASTAVQDLAEKAGIAASLNIPPPAPEPSPEHAAAH